MPAAAVIPAPIAYIKVVAVKKLVVEFLERAATSAEWCDAAIASSSRSWCGHSVVRIGSASFTVKKLECLKQALCLNTLAWNNEIGLRDYFVGCVPR